MLAVRRTVALLAALTTLCVGCAKGSEQHAATPPRASAKASSLPASAPRPAARGESGSAVPARAPVVHHGIAWYRDDKDAAFARARAENKPVVVDLWAAWCHTCLSMQEYVLTAEKLPAAAEQFVFLAIDTERAENSEFLSQLSISAWPTFYVLSPNGSVRGRWIGAASPGQFARFLADGRRLVELAASSAGTDDPLAELASGDELAGRGDFAAATAKYARVLERTPRDWPRRADALVARLMALKKAKLAEACVDAGLAEAPSTASPVSAADFAATLLACADQLPKGDPRVRRARRAAQASLTPLCHSGHADFTPDDRGDACGTLMEAETALGSAQAAKKAGLTRLDVLEAAASGMPDEIAAMYDFARSDTLVKLGRGREALASLQARERALPRNYNPPHQLARVYRALREWDAGLLAVDRAIVLAYGPRKAGIYGVKVDLLLGKRDREGALGTLREQLELYRSLPEGQKRPDAEQNVLSQIARVEALKDP
jgi:thioredoxin-like negative regulator of GroEL